MNLKLPQQVNLATQTTLSRAKYSSFALQTRLSS